VTGVAEVERAIFCSLSVFGTGAGRLGRATGACSSVEEPIVFGSGSIISGDGDGDGDGDRRPVSGGFVGETAAAAAGRTGRGGMAGVFVDEPAAGCETRAGRGGIDGGACAAIVPKYVVEGMDLRVQINAGG